MSASRAANVASAGAAVPSALLVPLYRQLLRAARAYAHEAQPRGVHLGAELARMCAPAIELQRATTLAAAVTPAGTLALVPEAPLAPTSPLSSSALSRQLDEWVRARPHIFHHVLIAEEKRRQAEEAATVAAQGGAAKPVEAQSQPLTAAATASPPRRKGSATAAASTSRPPTAAAASKSAPDAADGSNEESPAAPVRPPPPAWLAAMHRAGASHQVVQAPLLTGLLRRAFRLKPRDGKDASVRLSNAFALNKRLVERTAELRLLPLVPLRSRCVGEDANGLVRVSLRSLGVFKHIRGTCWFQIQWRVENVSPDRNIVLTQRKIVTRQREATQQQQQQQTSHSPTAPPPASSGGIYATTSEVMQQATAAAVPNAMAAAAAAQTGATSHSYAHGTSHTSLPARSPSSVSSSAASRSSLPSPLPLSSPPSSPPPGLRVESMGVGLAGRPLALPAGSSTGAQRALLRLDGQCGTLQAELTFTDVTALPHRHFTVALPPILLDAAAEWNEQDEEEEAAEAQAEAEQARAARALHSRHTDRHMMSSAAKAATQQQITDTRPASTPPPSGNGPRLPDA